MRLALMNECERGIKISTNRDVWSVYCSNQLINHVLFQATRRGPYNRQTVQKLHENNKKMSAVHVKETDVVQNYHVYV